MADAVVPRNNDPNDARHKPVWLRCEQVMYMLDISKTTLRNYETRTRNKLPRHKSNTPEGIVYYNAREIFEFGYAQRVRKEYGTDSPETATPTRKTSADAEKTRLVRAQAEAQELKNEIARGDVAPIRVLEDVLADVCSQISAILGSIPSNLRKRYSWLKATQLDQITTSITKAQNAAADVQITLITETQDVESDTSDTTPSK